MCACNSAITENMEMQNLTGTRTGTPVVSVMSGRTTDSGTSIIFARRLTRKTTKRALPRTARRLHAGFTRATFFCPRLQAGRRNRISFSFAVPRDLAH